MSPHDLQSHLYTLEAIGVGIAAGVWIHLLTVWMDKR